VTASIVSGLAGDEDGDSDDDDKDDEIARDDENEVEGGITKTFKCTSREGRTREKTSHVRKNRCEKS
jgi:hypothetical protein